jgi:hypothetical protein
LEYIENSIKSIKGQASQVNKNPDNFQIIVAAYPNVIEGQSSENVEKRFPFSGSIDEIGTDRHYGGNSRPHLLPSRLYTSCTFFQLPGVPPATQK